MASKDYWSKRQGQRLFEREFNRHTMSFLERFAWEISNELKNTFEYGSRSGREYKRGDKIHIASAPGEPPVTDSGQLVKSVTAPIKIPEGYKVGIGVEYAMYLELGTRKMAPRPYIKRSVDKAWENIKDLK